MIVEEGHISVPSRAMASLVADVAPGELARLKAQYPEQRILFNADNILGGEEVGSGSSGSSSTESLCALRDLVQTTMNVSTPALDTILRVLTSRAVTARRLRVGGAVLALVSGASFATILSSTYPWFRIVASIATLIGSISTLFGENLDRPIAGNRKGLSEMLKDAVALDASLSEMRIRLLSDDAKNEKSLISLAEKTNGLASSIREISIFSGIPLKVRTDR